MPPWTKASERCSLFHQLVKKNTTQSCFLRSLSFFRCRRLRHVGSHSSQNDGPKCSTLQDQSLGRYSRHVTSYGSLRNFTNDKVISVTFGLSRTPLHNIALRGCSTSVGALNCRSDRRQTGKNQMLHHVKSRYSEL